MKKQATYPQHLSFVERLAKKVISRVVSDGIPLDNAVKEAVSFQQLNTQQIFHLCSVLEDWGQVFNGDPKNYFYTATDMGKEFPNSQNGYVVYASANGKNDKMNQVFKTVTALKKQGFTDKDILNINDNLQEVLNVINEFDADYKTLVSEYQNSSAELGQQVPEKGWMERGKDWVGQQVNNLVPQPGMTPASASSNAKTVIAQVIPGEEVDENPETQKATPANVEKLKAEPELEVDEEELGGDSFGEDDLGDLEIGEEDVDLGGDMEESSGGASAPIRPTPGELMKRIEEAPKWEVANVLSMQMAETYYKNIQKDFEALTNNPNIDLAGSSAIGEYEKVRAQIEESINKIGEATKGAEKIEKKEDELEDKYESKTDIPTEELIAGEAIDEEPVMGQQPAEEPTLEVPEL